MQAQRSATAEVLPAEAMEGRRLLELTLQARGGQAALGKVQTLTMTGKGMLSMQGQQVPVTVEVKEIRGKAMREDIDMGGDAGAAGHRQRQGATSQQGDTRKDMPPEMKLEMEKAQFRDPNFIVLNAHAAGRQGARAQADGGRRRQLRHARGHLARG